ncbi:type IV conjugative transfer system lipoprotein TraV [Aliivibrio fischeri]|uniref:Type IV conjugative transfer system lipoprotein TraV n=2 Tax=Aliivibrio fischeri TaxID=668 RepID=A0A844P6Z6_ALIFS|nr:type IV conjugative transfer system lipoprotein TraV [Aliivibrio fischeri]MUK51110.1 type IV conjugative transfer system lipoprotein TraV [Aliivibrio fischeri]
MMHFSHLLRLLPVVLLTGCAAGMGDDFSCSAIDGFDGCATMNDIHTLADNGRFDTDSKGNVIATQQRERLVLSLPVGNNVNAPLHSGVPKRYQEQVKEIVIFPYQDSQGNYHDTAIIYTILAPSHWLTKPPTDIINSQYR